MAIQDEKLNQLNKELQNLMRQYDNDQDNEEYKRLKKNFKERIRVRTKNLTQGSTAIEEKKKKEKISVNVAYEMARGNTNAVLIAEKYGAKIKSVRWYLWKIKKIN